jgi:hypothetical protein
MSLQLGSVEFSVLMEVWHGILFEDKMTSIMVVKVLVIPKV